MIGRQYPRSREPPLHDFQGCSIANAAADTAKCQVTPCGYSCLGSPGGGDISEQPVTGHPALPLFDEPSQRLAPIIVQRIGNCCGNSATGATVLIAGQNMHFCLGLANHAMLIDKGQIVYISGIEELKANDNIRQRYLAL
jgi:branched-chain amino acid transport system ATP-binding protein